jgi:catechol 2,3-dioxygenase-like lactoylglutathione lyase family enzyme
MAVTGILHTGLTVRNLDRSLHFYVDLLGLTHFHSQVGDNAYTRTLVGLPDAVLKAALLRLGDQPGHVLELIEYLHPAGKAVTSRPCDPGTAHLSLRTDDLAGLYRRLLPEGVAFVNPPVEVTAGINKGGYLCYLRDPDGFILEFLQPPPRTAAP